MRKFIIYFEFYGRKMKTTVEAYNIQAAKQQVIDKINFIEIQDKQENYVVEFFENLHNNTKKHNDKLNTSNPPKGKYQELF